MPRHRYHLPLDPECPEVIRYYEADLPLIRQMGAPVDDFLADFEAAHRKSCERCEEYGVANIEVE